MIGLPLSIKYQQRAYLYYIIAAPCEKDPSFEILLEGENCKIYLDETNSWVESGNDNTAAFDPQLIELIGKALICHFHIRKHNYM